MDPKDDDATAVQPTIDYPSPTRPEPPRAAPTTPASASGGGGPSPRVEVVAGSGVHLSEETRSLLRVRLRAVALAMSCAFGAFLVRDLWLGGHYRDPFLLTFHVAVVAAFLASFAVLSGRRPIALRRLRALELVLFGMTIAFFVTIHYRLVQLRVAEGDRVMLMATVKNTVLFVFAMIVLYGMFIPNTWRRAAAVVAAMVAATILSPLALRILHPEVFRFAAPLLTFETVSDNVLMLLIGAGVTVYATHIINALRVEAFEARQLNQYRLKGRIGAGGMGVVYLAEHQLLKRPCAIKLIAPDRAGDPKALARFEREVRTTARLSHPNTVEIYDYGRTEDGTFYYVMELLDGLSLADLVDAPRPPAARAGHLPAPPGVRRVGRGARRRAGPPRPEAGEHLRRPPRQPARLRQAPRLRPRPAPARPVGRRAQPGRPHRRLAAVHGPGAGHRRRAARRPHRPLRPGRRRLLTS